MRRSRLTVPHVDPFRCFPGQRAGERAVIFARHHWLFDVGTFIPFLIWSLAPAAALLILNVFHVAIPSDMAWNAILLLYCWYVMVLGLIYYIRWLDIYLDYFVISTERIVDVDQVSLFDQTISETSLSEIQDVECHVHGFWGTLVGFGDLTIQTAGEKSNFYMEHLPHPMEIRSQVLDLRDRYVEHIQAAAFTEALAAQRSPDGIGGSTTS